MKQRLHRIFILINSDLRLMNSKNDDDDDKASSTTKFIACYYKRKPLKCNSRINNKLALILNIIWLIYWKNYPHALLSMFIKSYHDYQIRNSICFDSRFMGIITFAWLLARDFSWLNNFIIKSSFYWVCLCRLHDAKIDTSSFQTSPGDVFKRQSF